MQVCNTRCKVKVFQIHSVGKSAIYSLNSDSIGCRTCGNGILNKEQQQVVGEPRPKFGKLQGRGAIKGLKADFYVKQPAGSESGLRL